MSQDWNNPNPDDVQVPLDTTGGETPVEEIAPSKAKLPINSSTLALIFAFAAALTVLYFLGKQAKPRPASAAEQAKATELDQGIKDWLQRHNSGAGVESGAGKDDPIKKLTQRIDAMQTKGGEEAIVNPFVHPEKPEPVVVNTTQPEQIPVGPTVDPNLVEAAREFNGLKLQLVALGSTSASSSAMINNQLVRVGSQFKFLTVTEIKSDSVVLSYKDKSFELKSGK